VQNAGTESNGVEIGEGSEVSEVSEGSEGSEGSEVVISSAIQR
jgi:hypothetical protein